jgi:DNA-binding GntR family transcriptional regulator
LIRYPVVGENMTIPRTVKETLVDGLRDEIVQGASLPGQKLRLEEIAARFGVSQCLYGKLFGTWKLRA